MMDEEKQENVNQEPRPPEEQKTIDKLFPICPHCGADPLPVVGRQCNIPFSMGAPNLPIIILFCAKCRQQIKASDVVVLPWQAGNEQGRIATPQRGPLVVPS